MQGRVVRETWSMSLSCCFAAPHLPLASPAAAMPASGLPQWRHVSVQTQYVLAGGYSSSKTHPLETMEVDTGKHTMQFCKVTKNDLWLLKCAGPLATKGMLKRSKILEQLKDKLSDASQTQDPMPQVRQCLRSPQVQWRMTPSRNFTK